MTAIDAVLIFPGQGSQFVGMAKQIEEKFPFVKTIFEKANEVLGWDLHTIMREGSVEDLKQTKVTQNAIFVYSVASWQLLKDKIKPQAVAGHSLGEFSALVASRVLDFEDALQLVNIRATAMQKACEANPSTMSAVLGLEEKQVTAICQSIKDEVVVPANFNCPGQVVISGSFEGINKAQELLKQAGAKRVLPLAVGGGFHSPLMMSAQDELEQAIVSTVFNEPHVPIYQNVVAEPVKDKELIKLNLIKQLTASVLWTQSIQQMQQDGLHNFVEVGPGKVLQSLVNKIFPQATTNSWEHLLS